MMYGIGMPILFPLSALAIFAQWATERYLIVKEVELPPAMNDYLIINAMNKLKYAPLFLLFNGYWMIDNR